MLLAELYIKEIDGILFFNLSSICMRADKMKVVWFWSLLGRFVILRIECILIRSSII